MGTNIANIDPRRIQPKRGSYKLFQLDQLQNPLPAQVRDSDRLRQFFRNYPYVPYSTDQHYTSHSLMKLLAGLRTLSATQNAVIKSKQLFGFGGKIRFKEATDEIYDMGEEEETFLAGSELQARIDIMKTINHAEGNPLKSIQRGHLYYETTGDIYIEVALSQVIGQKSSLIKIHNPDTVLYMYPTDEDIQAGLRVLGICKDWEYAYSGTEPVRHIPLYPNFTRDENGIARTMIHYKNGDGDFYGRPPSQGSLPNQYNEFLDAIYLIKLSNRNFTAQLIYEMEDDAGLDSLDETARKSGYRNFAAMIEANATNRSQDPQTFIAHTRPAGSRPSTLHQIKPNTSEGFYTTTGDLHKYRIINSHQWSPRLIGENVSTGWDSNVYWDEAFVKEWTVLKALRAQVLEPFNDAYRIIYQHYGVDPDIVIDLKGMVETATEKADQRAKQKAANNPIGKPEDPEDPQNPNNPEPGKEDEDE